MEYAVDFAEIGAGEIYEVVITSTMRWLTYGWKENTTETILN